MRMRLDAVPLYIRIGLLLRLRPTPAQPDRTAFLTERALDRHTHGEPFIVFRAPPRRSVVAQDHEGEDHMSEGRRAQTFRRRVRGYAGGRVHIRDPVRHRVERTE